MSKWKDISTAPTTEERIIVARLQGHKIMWWHKASRREGTRGASYKYGAGYCIPTHWLPIPPASEVEQ